MKNFERVNTEPGYDHCGRINFMCQSGGYVMVKRARAVPFVLTLKDWAKLPKTADEGRWAVVFNGRVEILKKVKG